MEQQPALWARLQVFRALPAIRPPVSAAAVQAGLGVFLRGPQILLLPVRAQPRDQVVPLQDPRPPGRRLVYQPRPSDLGECPPHSSPPICCRHRVGRGVFFEGTKQLTATQPSTFRVANGAVGFKASNWKADSASTSSMSACLAVSTEQKPRAASVGQRL